MKAKQSILILCTGNSARSQMAEALLRNAVGESFDVHSAGTQPSTVRSEAIAAMAELGIDISGHRSKSVDEFLDRSIDYVLTVCDHAKETCPYFPAGTRTYHHSFSDPAKAEGTFEERLDAFRSVRDAIAEYLEREFIGLLHSEAK